MGAFGFALGVVEGAESSVLSDKVSGLGDATLPVDARRGPLAILQTPKVDS